MMNKKEHHTEPYLIAFLVVALVFIIESFVELIHELVPSIEPFRLSMMKVGGAAIFIYLIINKQLKDIRKDKKD